MKKIFSLFAAVLFAGSMWAQTTYTFTSLGTPDDATADGLTFTFQKNSGSTNPAWNGGSSELRLYAKGSLTITSSTSRVTKVVYEYVVNKNRNGKFPNVDGVEGTTNKGTWTESTKTWEDADGDTEITLSTSGEAGNLGFKSITVTLESGAAASVAKPVIEGETSFYDETEVTLSCTTEGAKIYYTLDGTEPSATSTEYLGSAIKLNATATVKAIAINGEDKSSIVEKKFTKAPEFASIEALVAAGLATGTKVTVSFSEVEITNIFENKSGKRQGIYLDVKAGDKDVEIYYNADDVPEAWNIGGVVSGTIQGTWTLYNGQWEIVPATTTWKWTELTYNVPSVIAIIIPTTSYNAPAAGISGTIDVTYNNIADLSSAAVAFYEEDGTTPATYAWLTTSFDEEKNVTYNVAASEEAEARVAYLKVYVGEVYSDLVTIRQAKFVPAYTTLPFAFDGGKADVEDTPGLTQSGLGSDYSASPKLKFDGSNDYLILQFNEDAGQLSFDIKGNSFSGGTFTVQTSADGENYTDLKAYTDLDAVATEEIDIKSGVRYIKWIYTEKVSGNVALGNISLEKAKDPTAIDNTAFEAKTFKTFENGQLVIIKNGIKYNATGAVIR